MKLSIKVKTAYGIIGVADQCLYFLFGTFFLFFATTVAGIDAGTAGLIAAVGALWDAISSAVIGHISDKVHTPLGRRRVFIMCASLPVAVVTALLFTAVDLPMSMKILYYFVMSILFWTGFSSFFIPYLAWGAELTEDYNERTQIRAFAYAGNTVGMAIGAVLPTIIVDYISNMGYSLAQAWHGTAMIISCCVFLVLFMGAFIVGRPNETELKMGALAASGQEKNAPNSILGEIADIFISFKEVLKLKPLRFLVYGSVCYLAANTIFVADRLYFYTYNMGLGAVEITLLMGIEPFAGVIFLPMLAFLNRYLDKRGQFIAGMLICGISMLMLRFVEIDTFFEAAYMLVAFGLGAICYWQLMPAMIYDLCEIDEMLTGRKRQGVIVSLQAISESLSEALGLVILGNMLEMAGFDGSAANQGATALHWVENAFTFIPGVFMLIAVVMVYMYPITREVFGRVLEAVELKRQGKEVKNLEELKSICKLD